MPAAVAIPAIIGAAGVGTSVAGAVMGSKASSQAADAQVSASKYAADLQKQSSDEALAFQKQQWETAQKNQQPWIDAGKGALGDLTANLGDLTKGFDPSTVDVTQDPGYAFRLAEGQKALERSAAARGSTLGGAALKELTRYSQGVASQEYGAAYDRAFNTFQANQGNRWNRLASLAGVGQTATQQLNSAGANFANNSASIVQNTGNNLADLAVGAGNAKASGYMGSANAWANALGGITNTATSIGNYYATKSYLSDLLKGLNP